MKQEFSTSTTLHLSLLTRRALTFAFIFSAVLLLPVLYAMVRNPALYPTFLMLTAVAFCLNAALYGAWHTMSGRGIHADKSQLTLFFMISYVLFLIISFMLVLTGQTIGSFDDAFFNFIVFPLLYMGLYTANYLLFWRLYRMI